MSLAKNQPGHIKQNAP